MQSLTLQPFTMAYEGTQRRHKIIEAGMKETTLNKGSYETPKAG